MDINLLFKIAAIGILVAGIVGIFNISYAIAVAIVTICYIFINFAKGVYEVLTSRYLSNFTTEKELTQIYAIDETCRNGLRAILGFLGSYLLEITSAANFTYFSRNNDGNYNLQSNQLHENKIRIKTR